MKKLTGEKDKRIEQLSSMVLRVGMIRTALDVLCESFLVRAKDFDEDPLWKSFYHIQMSSYIIRKKSLEIAAPEGDMIHDLIKDAWTEVKSYMDNSAFGPVQNVENWFRTIRIDFPVDLNDPIFVTEQSCENKVCQNDTKLDGFTLIV